MSWSFQHATEIRFGAGVAGGVGAAAARFGRQALLVTGGASFARAPWAPALIESFATAGVGVARFAVAAEPDTAVVDAAARAAHACDCVVAIGGGSAMDVAKAAAVLAANGGAAIDYLEGLPHGGGKPITRAPLPVICAPTTAGTGSEVTKNAVLQAGAFKVKRSMRSDLMFPRLALVDPLLLASCPRPIAAACGFDALTHLVESWCSPRASPLIDALAGDGIARAHRSLRRLAAGAAPMEVAEDLALAATLGGICLVNAGLGAAHGLVAPLGGLFADAPHGAALACLLPATLRVNAAAAARAGASRARERLGAVASMLGHAGGDVAAACADLDALRRALALPGLGAYGVTVHDLGSIAAAPSGSLGTNPVTLSGEELVAILRSSL
ncbi:MAG TPA: iron-containing alcohol dehydrogenase [Planctomycetota bacterium]|nr:iron-containing alcohol dehydrogenase [Planctomycetota bacterium]